jgi:hypothetical protein
VTRLDVHEGLYIIAYHNYGSEDLIVRLFKGNSGFRKFKLKVLVIGLPI